jgi:hypothetical protein
VGVSSWAAQAIDSRQQLRARRATRIYVTEAALEIESHAPASDRPDSLNRLARALATPAARPLAHTLERERSIELER